MTVITHVRRKSRLSKLIDQAGGLSVGVALAQARANIETLRTQSLAFVAEQIAGLGRIPAPTSTSDSDERLDEVYQTANAIIDAAAPFELDDVCTAASGLCDLVDATPAGRSFDWRIVTVHAQSLRLLLDLPAEELAAREQILASLREILKVKLPHQPD